MQNEVRTVLTPARNNLVLEHPLDEKRSLENDRRSK